MPRRGGRRASTPAPGLRRRAIEGHGEWRLERLDAGTRVVYELDVQVRGWLVALLDRIISLPRVHSRQMQGVFKNLERHSRTIEIF
jgi:hypothetical protein